jgi:hypothetical protein
MMWHSFLYHESSYMRYLVLAHLVIMFALGSWCPRNPGVTKVKPKQGRISQSRSNILFMLFSIHSRVCGKPATPQHQLLWQVTLKQYGPHYLKRKCALGPFLSILVIKCPTQMVMCWTMPNGGQSANQYKGMILDLVHWFLCTNIFV